MASNNVRKMMPNAAVVKSALEQELEALRAQNAALMQQVASKQTISFKVSEKGAVSVYGLGRWPVTLYREQWERLLAKGEDIKAFILANASKLSVKGQ